MPFSREFWKSPPTLSAPAGIKGFICALPMEWTQGENNHPDMNMALLTRLEDAHGEPTRHAMTHTASRNEGVVG